MNYVKHLIKKHFQFLWLGSRYSPAVQISQRQLFHFYQIHCSNRDKINLRTSGFRVFSQFEEDGKILFILAVIGVSHGKFVEIGSDDGINSNCANLALNFNWHGLFIDANKRSIERGRHFYKRHPIPYGSKPKFIQSKVSRENINQLLEANDFGGEIDLLSIDIDGNDYWIWDAITVTNPRIVIIETHNIYGRKNIVCPYDPSYSFPGKHPQYHGASPIAMLKLGQQKGYRLVGANDLGFNFIFLRNDLGTEIIPTVTIDEVLAHPSCAEDEKSVDPVVWTYPFETPIA